jgi:uncharacterized repeat protein (TIGR01451 family)
MRDGVKRGSRKGRTKPPRRQVVVIAVGVALVFGGLLAIVLPQTPTISPGIINAVGILTVCCFVYVAVRWLLLEADVERSPSVERRAGRKLVGHDFEKSVKRRDVSEAGPAIEKNIREKLRDLATDLAARRGNDVAEPATQAGRQSWTRDPEVDEFLAGDSTTGTTEEAANAGVRSSDPPVEGLLSRIPMDFDVLPGESSPFESTLERTVDELAAIGGVETSDKFTWVDTEFEDRPEEWSTGTGTTNKWRGLTGLGLITLGIGALFKVPGLILVTGLLLGVAGYTRVLTPPEPELDVERSFDTEHPAPGETVAVTVTVRNDGDSIITDLRLVDDVPDRLAVESESPRHATALRPGESDTFEYDVLAVYGTHEFGRLHVATRDASGHRERRETVTTPSKTLDCEPGVLQGEVPLHPASSGITGRVRSETAGSGQEFRSVREYRRGDPLRRVDWNRLARTGKLASLQFTEEQAATVVLVVDAREPAFKSPAPGSLSALDRSLAGVSQLFTTLDGDGDRVGLASIGADWLWIEPGSGPEHRSKIRNTLQNEPAFERRDSRGSFVARAYVRELRRRLPNDAQLVVFTPLLDDTASAVIQRLSGYGHDVTVFSSDVTRTETVGSTVARLKRNIRLANLRRKGLPVVDWSADEPLESAAVRATRWEL